MFYYPLAAAPLQGDRLCRFRLEDGPCAVDRKTFILLNRPNSPILRYDSLYRASLVDDILEGDILELDSEELVVIYFEGFWAVSETKKIRLSEMERTPKIVGHVFRTPRDNFIKWKKPPAYKSGSDLWSFRQIIGADACGISLNYKGATFVPYGDIQQIAALEYEGKRLYFGDKVNGSPLHLLNGNCCIKNRLLKERGI